MFRGLDPRCARAGGWHVSGISLLVGIGAWALFAGVAIATVDAIGVVTQSMRRPTVSIRPAA